MVGNGEFLVDFATDRRPIIGAEDVVNSDIHPIVAISECHPISLLTETVSKAPGNGMVGIRGG